MDTDEKGAANARCEGYKTRVVYTATPMLDHALDLLARCQENLDPHRDVALWSDVCAALAPKP
jgi:hypothetical protein